jgi:hypothetical protein
MKNMIICEKIAGCCQQKGVDDGNQKGGSSPQPAKESHKYYNIKCQVEKTMKCWNKRWRKFLAFPSRFLLTGLIVCVYYWFNFCQEGTMELFCWILIFVFFVYLCLWGISIYLIKTEKMSVKKWSLRSFGLPQGSVRATIALLLLFLLLKIALSGNDLQVPDLPDWLVGILGTVIGFYFGAALIKKPEDKSDQD